MFALIYSWETLSAEQTGEYGEGLITQSPFKNEHPGNLS